MSTVNLQQLKEDIELNLLEVLNNSKFTEVLKNYDIPTEALKVELKLDNQQLLSIVRVCPCNPAVDPPSKCCWKNVP